MKENRFKVELNNYYGEMDAAFVEDKIQEMNKDYNELVLTSKISYKGFLKLYPHVLYNQRRSMMYNLLNARSSASRETREASIYKYVLNPRRRNTKMHEILFGDDACIFPDMYDTLFEEKNLSLVYLKLMFTLATELEIPTQKLKYVIAYDLVRYLRDKFRYYNNSKYAPRIGRVRHLVSIINYVDENPFLEVVNGYDSSVAKRTNANGNSYLTKDITSVTHDIIETFYEIFEEGYNPETHLYLI